MEAEVSNIIVLPTEENDRQLHGTAAEQLRSLVTFINGKIAECQEKMSENLCMFAVNYLQNRCISNEFTVQIANLFEIMQVRKVPEFEFALDALRADGTETASLLKEFDDCVARWESLLDKVERRLDDQLGPPPPKNEDVLDAHSSILLFTKNSAYDLFLVTIVRSFAMPEINQHILSLYNRMPDFHSHGCEVSLMTKMAAGGGKGTGGGSYLKLIGVPFRKLYDEQRAIAELKRHRTQAQRLAGWRVLLTLVEANIGDESRARTGMSENNVDTERRPSAAIAAAGDRSEAEMFIAHFTGCILFDRSGAVTFKHVEDDEQQAEWPAVDTLFQQVCRLRPEAAAAAVADERPSSASKAVVAASTNGLSSGKVDSEISADEKKAAVSGGSGSGEDKEKKCCTIL